MAGKKIQRGGSDVASATRSARSGRGGAKKGAGRPSAKAIPKAAQTQKPGKRGRGAAGAPQSSSAVGAPVSMSLAQIASVAGAVAADDGAQEEDDDDDEDEDDEDEEEDGDDHGDQDEDSEDEDVVYPCFNIRDVLASAGEAIALAQRLSAIVPKLVVDTAGASSDELVLWTTCCIVPAATLETGDVLVSADSPATTLDVLSSSNVLHYFEVVEKRASGVLLHEVPEDPSGVEDLFVALEGDVQVLCLRETAVAAMKRARLLGSPATKAPVVSGSNSKRPRDTTWRDPRSGKSYVVCGDISQKMQSQVGRTLCYRRFTDDTVLSACSASVLDLDTKLVWAMLVRAANNGYEQGFYRLSNLSKFPYIRGLSAAVATDYFAGLEPGIFIGVARFSLLTASGTADNAGRKFELAESLHTLERFMIFVHGEAYVDVFSSMCKRLTEGELLREEWDYRFLTHRINEVLSHVYFVVATYARAEFSAQYHEHSLGCPTAVACWMAAEMAGMRLVDTSQSWFLRSLTQQPPVAGGVLRAPAAGAAAAYCKFHLLFASGNKGSNACQKGVNCNYLHPDFTKLTRAGKEKVLKAAGSSRIISQAELAAALERVQVRV